MARSYQDFDRPYRRGLVLGLSLAELFLILLFLLLLASIGMIEQAKKKTNKYKELYERTSLVDASFIMDIENKFGQKLEEIDFIELIKASEKMEELKKENDILKTELIPLEKYKKLDEILKDKNLSELDKKDIVNKINTILEEANNKEELIENIEAIDQDLKDQNSKLTAEIEHLKILLKGRNPPCWYNDVDDQYKPEKELFTFDIKMSDDTLMILKLPIPLENNTVHIGNSNNLPNYPIDSIGKEISYNKFTNQFWEYKIVGKDKLIQEYSCVFFVKLWDKTTNKQSYKNRLNQINAVFYHAEVFNDPWNQ